MTPRPLSPEEQMIASYLAGRGLYSGLQLKNIAFDDDSDESPDDDVLKVKIPKSLLHKESGHNDNLLLGNLGSLVSQPVSSALSGFSGFSDGAKTYDKMEKEHLNAELDAAEKEYLDLLSSIRKKGEAAEKTPLVDAFITGIVHTASLSEEDIEKEAKDDTDMSDSASFRAIQDLISPITNRLKPVTDTAKGVTAGTTLGSALAVYLMKQRMEGGSKSPHDPQRILLEGV